MGPLCHEGQLLQGTLEISTVNLLNASQCAV